MLQLGGPCGAGFPAAFSPADFSAAQSGPQAAVLSFIHPAWTRTLSCDPDAQWIGGDPQATPHEPRGTVARGDRGVRRGTDTARGKRSGNRHARSRQQQRPAADGRRAERRAPRNI